MDNNEEMIDVEATGSGFSRRTALKGAGIGVAVWAAPTVLSMGAVAHAASVAPPLSCQDCDPNGDPCSNQTACGDPNLNCTCKTIAAGGACLCTGNGGCGDFPGCASQADCAPGSSCVANCCGVLLCLPNCSDADAIKKLNRSNARSHGPRTDGK